MPPFPRNFGKGLSRDEEEELLKKLEQAYAKQDKYSIIGDIFGGLSTMFAPAGANVGAAQKSFSDQWSAQGDIDHATSALEAYYKSRDQQGMEDYRNQQLELSQQGLEQDQSQFEDKLDQDLMMDQQKLYEMEQQDLEEQEWRQHQMQMQEQQFGLQNRQLSEQVRQNQLAEQAAQAQAEEKRREQMESGVRDLSKQIPEDPTAAARSTLNQKLTNDYPPGKNIPGIGVIEGNLAGGFVGPKGREMRSLVSTLNLALTKVLVGAGSDEEKRMAAEATNLMKSSRDDDVRRGIDLANKAIELSNQRAMSGYSPEVVEEYKRRNQTLQQQPSPATQMYRSAIPRK